jgi:FAD/FMN-containing dehydrogenase
VDAVAPGNVSDLLQSVLVRGTVSRDPADMAAFRVRNPIIDPPVAPSHVVRPADTEELQRVMRAANEQALNLTLASSTGGHCKGGFAATRDNILVDLSSWKQIPWINRRNRVCLVEPGVTYGELARALAPHGMTVPMPLAPRSGKSAVAAVMDREPSTWPNRQWDSADPVASTEIIFGSGDFFRTGAAGGPGTPAAQRLMGGAQKSPAGPSQTDFHRVVQGSQGTIGAVTWITVRVELKPTIERPLLLGADSLAQLIPFVYEVQRPWLGEHSFIMDRTAAALLLNARGGEMFDAVRPTLPRYLCLQNIAGFERLPRERVEYQTKDVEQMARRNGLEPVPALGRVSAQALLDITTTPAGDLDWRHHLRGHCLSIFFLSTLDRVPGLIDMFAALTRSEELGEESVGCYVQPVVQNHACHVELLVPFDAARPGEVDRMRRLEREAVRELAAAGAFFSRPYGSTADTIFGQNPVSHDVLKKVKGIFDPNKVLNRGKWDL